jgi:hypothetical protein
MVEANRALRLTPTNSPGGRVVTESSLFYWAGILCCGSIVFVPLIERDFKRLSENLGLLCM